MPRTTLMGVDPGLLTGMALLDITERNNPKPIASLEANIETFYRVSEETIAEDADKLIVVCENYIITTQTAKLAQAPWSLRNIGVLDYLCKKHSVPMILQGPSEAKEFSTDEKLRKAGFIHTGGEGHANDAWRHVMKYHADRSPRWTGILSI